MLELKSASEIIALRDSSMRMIAVDIGNTALKFGLFDLPQLKNRSRANHSFFYPFSMDDLRILPKQLKILPAWLSTFSHRHDEPFLWLVASVNQQQTNSLFEFLQEYRPHDQFGLLSTNDVPLKTVYRNPNTLGIDRKLAALAASRRFLPSVPVMIVDIGTATKIDLVDETGVFRGGAILPGPALCLRSLSENTDKLPNLDWSLRKIPDSYPAENTEDAIYLGTFSAVSGSLLACYDAALRETHRNSIPIILTGGGAAGIEPRLSQFLARFYHEEIWMRTIRDLVLSGIEFTRQSLTVSISAAQ